MYFSTGAPQNNQFDIVCTGDNNGNNRGGEPCHLTNLGLQLTEGYCEPVASTDGYTYRVVCRYCGLQC